MYFSGLHGQRTSFWPGASGAPTLWRHGTTRFSSLSFSVFEPSTKWIDLGLVNSAVFSTHLTRCILRVSGPRERAVFIAILIGEFVRRRWKYVLGLLPFCQSWCRNACPPE